MPICLFPLLFGQFDRLGGESSVDHGGTIEIGDVAVLMFVGVIDLRLGFDRIRCCISISHGRLFEAHLGIQHVNFFRSMAAMR